jgi:hypothetical protein
MNTSSHASSQLAQKYQVPQATIEQLIEEETAVMLERARFTSFVPILVARRVEERLRNGAFPTFPDQRQAA